MSRTEVRAGPTAVGVATGASVASGLSLAGVATAGAAGAALAAFAHLAAGAPWVRAIVVGALLGGLVLLARCVPVGEVPAMEDRPSPEEATGWYHASLLAASLARAADDPQALRRIVPRLRALAERALAQRGSDLDTRRRGGSAVARQPRTPRGCGHCPRRGPEHLRARGRRPGR